MFFADEPILRITAPLPQAQLIETRLINIVHFQVSSPPKPPAWCSRRPASSMVDFGLRRAHGAEAGLMAARASYIAGFAGTATVLADRLFGIPIFGTMAHSSFRRMMMRSAAFEMFAQSRPENLTLLIDSYDTEAGARKDVALAPRLARARSRYERCGWTAAIWSRSPKAYAASSMRAGSARCASLRAGVSTRTASTRCCVPARR